MRSPETILRIWPWRNVFVALMRLCNIHSTAYLYSAVKEPSNNFSRRSDNLSKAANCVSVLIHWRLHGCGKWRLFAEESCPGLTGCTAHQTEPRCARTRLRGSLTGGTGGCGYT